MNLFNVQIKKTYLHLAFLLIIFLALKLIFFKAWIIGDGIHQYSQLRSIVIDKDLNFSNEYEHFQGLHLGNVIDPKSRTITGLPPNPWPIGNAVLWSPFFLTAHLIEKMNGESADGYSKRYIDFVTKGTLVYSFLTLVLIYLLLNNFFKEDIALLVTSVIFISTSFIFYTFIDPSMSHALSAFTTTLFLYYWYCTRKKRSILQSIILGFVAGLMIITRWQDSIFLLIMLGDLKKLIFKKWKSDHEQSYGLFSFSITLAMTFTAQMIFWKKIYGSYLIIPQYQGFILWYPKYVLKVLFSPVHGLLIWTPIIIFSIIGIILYQKENLKKSFLPLYLLIILMLQIYVNSSTADWNGSWSFGSRRFVSCTVIFAFGIAYLIDIMTKKIKMRYIILFFSLFMIWNLLLITQAYVHHDIIAPEYKFSEIFINQVMTSPNNLLALINQKFSNNLLFFSARFKMIPINFNNR